MHSMELVAGVLGLPALLVAGQLALTFSNPVQSLCMQVYVSYGGLLMQLTGDPKRLEDLDIDQNIYMLIRKV